MWLSERRSGLVNLVQPLSCGTVLENHVLSDTIYLLPLCGVFYILLLKVWSLSKVYINHDFQRTIYQTEKKKIKLEKFLKKSKTGHTNSLQGLAKTELEFMVSLLKSVIWQLKNKINLLCLSPAHLVALTIPGIWAPTASQQPMPSAPSAGLFSHFLK